MESYIEKLKAAKAQVKSSQTDLKAATSADGKKKCGIALGEAKKALTELKNSAPKKDEVIKYKNKCRGVFSLPGISWDKNEAKEVPKEILETSRFKNAVRCKALVKA